ncbi:MAG: hypothetical protein LBU62_03140 [Bacteroidales bacterium]|jgi:hypothetical protein|nr:hypothetical protein [Bacteroidales bacterium]
MKKFSFIFVFLFTVALAVESAQFPDEKRNAAEQQLVDDLLNNHYGFKDLLVVERKALQTSHVYTYHVEGFKPGGGLCIFSPNEDGGTLEKIVDAGDGMILDADLHWNGQDIVFSWKKNGRFFYNAANHIGDISQCANPDENYQIWTVKIDGSDLRQITNSAYNNLNACWLPDGGIAFISDRKPAYAYCWVVTSPVLYRMDRDGSNAKRLSANYLMDFTPSVLNDGRIIYTRWEYVDKCAIPIQSLWTISPDGTNLSGYFGNRINAPSTFMDANAIPNSQKIMTLATNHNGSPMGGIVQIDTRFGPNSLDGVKNTTPEVDIYRDGTWCHGNELSGQYEKPFALNENTYLVTKGGDIQIRTMDGHGATLLSKNQKTNDGYYSVQPIRSYPVPPVVKSSTINEAVVLPEDGRVSGNWGIVTMQDVYRGLEPTVKRGEVKRIAVIQEIEKPVYAPLVRPHPNGAAGQQEDLMIFGFQFPIVSCGATYAPKKVWGFADVAPDGSATFEVPSEVPIYFMALDGEGRAVQRMRTFTHLMPGEIQGCIGCHIDRNTQIPNNARRTMNNTQTLNRVIHNSTNMAAVQELQKPAWDVKGFSYREVVQPVLNRNCMDCHNAHQKSGNVDLSGDYTDFFNVSYDHLARKGTLGEKDWRQNGVPRDSRKEGTNPYTSWIWTINGAEWNTTEVEPKRWGSPASKLSEILRNGHPDKAGNKRIDVAQSDRERIYLWIDLNVPYYPTSASNHNDQLGCRRIYPTELDAALADVSKRRCAECHSTGIPREFYTRFENPQNNSFLLAPLSKEAGGTQRCGKVIFRNTNDADYQLILKTFESVQQLVKERPREDMPMDEFVFSYF